LVARLVFDREPAPACRVALTTVVDRDPIRSEHASFETAMRALRDRDQIRLTPDEIAQLKRGKALRARLRDEDQRRAEPPAFRPQPAPQAEQRAMTRDSERSRRIEFRGGLVGRLMKPYRASSNWYCSWWHEGREQRESTGTADFEVAKRKLRAKLEELQAVKRGHEPYIAPQNKRVTVSELYDALETDLRLRDCKSLKQSRSHIMAVKTVFGARRALTLTREAVDAQVEAWRAQRHAAATINRRLQLLGQAFRLAHERKRIPAVPTFRLLRVHNARQGFFEKADFERVIANIDDVHLRDFLEWFFWTGMRPGEIRSLTWEALDRETWTLRLHAKDAKTGYGRVIPLENELRAIIERRWEARTVMTKQGPRSSAPSCSIVAKARASIGAPCLHWGTSARRGRQRVWRRGWR
jgi:integrase